MQKIALVLIIGLVVVGMSMAIVRFSPMYSIAIIAGIALVCLIFFKIIKPIWIIAIVFIFAPFVDILRATYFKAIPFMGVYQELILVLLLISKLIATPDKKSFPRLDLLDYLVILYIIWNLFEVIQSPSIVGGLYVWRWYSIGPLTYLIFRLYSFSKQDIVFVISSICIGLAAASIYIFYQYFILGPDKAAQMSQALGFTAFYRIGWRLPGPFGSPLVASAGYSVLVLFGIALIFLRRLTWVGFSLSALGGIAIFFTLSRSGIAISLVGLVAVVTMNVNKVKNILLPVLLGTLLVLQFSSAIPETKQFLAYVTNTKLDAYDNDRLDQFKYILTEAVTKYPFGIGFSGGGAISGQAILMFGGNSTYIPKYLGGDSVFFATLQTSGFLGLFLLFVIYALLIRNSIWLLARPLPDAQRVFCLVSFCFFVGTLITLGNLVDVWPLKLYLWSFGALVINIRIAFSKSQTNPNLQIFKEPYNEAA